MCLCVCVYMCVNVCVFVCVSHTSMVHLHRPLLERFTQTKKTNNNDKKSTHIQQGYCSIFSSSLKHINKKQKYTYILKTQTQEPSISFTSNMHTNTKTKCTGILQNTNLSIPCTSKHTHQRHASSYFGTINSLSLRWPAWHPG